MSSSVHSPHRKRTGAMSRHTPVPVAWYQLHGLEDLSLHKPTASIQQEPQNVIDERVTGGKCLFVALAQLMTTPPTHRLTRRMVSDFYQNASSACLSSLSPFYNEEQLRERGEVIARPGVWGDGVDVMTFASVTNMNIRAVALT